MSVTSAPVAASSGAMEDVTLQDIPHLIRGVSLDSMSILRGAREHAAWGAPSLDTPPHTPSMIGMATFNSTFHGLTMKMDGDTKVCNPQKPLPLLPPPSPPAL